MPAPAEINLSDQARNDLRAIYRYSVDQWGPTRASRYADQLSDDIWSLLSHPERGSLRDDLLPGVRALITGRHVIYYRHVAAQVEIVRVLVRQDPGLRML